MLEFKKYIIYKGLYCRLIYDHIWTNVVSLRSVRAT